MAKKTTKEVIQEKSARVLNGVAYWASFYRKNPQRFAKDFLNVNLKTFQKILLYEMMINHYFIYVAARGQGKTWVISLFCVIRCILYPGTKIVVCSGTKGQAIEVLSKITDDFCKNYQWGSSNLNNEISFKSTSINNAVIEFKNGSWIKAATSTDNARGMRANILIADEFRMISLEVINKVLRRFLSAPRTPGYLSKPKYKHLEERNKEIYMTSAWYASHWSFAKIKSYFINMMDCRKYFVCSLPYQLSIKEGLLLKGQIEDEMSEDDFNEMGFSMEMESLFYSDLDDGFFSFSDLDKCRRLKNAFYPLSVYEAKGMQVPRLSKKEERILSVDIALMSSAKNANDASSLIINSAIQTSETDFISNIVYMENHEGLTTDELGIIIMRTFYEYKCTQLVIDANGVGMGVFDYLIKDQYDTKTGKTYKAFTCCNNDEMAKRCKVQDANKCLWAIKASATLNNEMCIMLRSCIQNGKINLLVHEIEAEETMRTKISGYGKMSGKEQALLKIPYVQTSYLINELVNLEYKTIDGNIKVFEKSGARKDRYSSLEYNIYVLQQISRKKRPVNKDINIVDILTGVSKMPKKYNKFN